jgi:hypothetical protein
VIGRAGRLRAVQVRGRIAFGRGGVRVLRD